jgi:hypothetical protein
MKRTLSTLVAAAAFALPFAAALAPLAISANALAHDEKADMAKMVEERAAAYVTVKYVLKGEGDGMGMGMGGDQEMEITGVMIDPKGLVLVSSTEFMGFMSRMMGGGGGPTRHPGRRSQDPRPRLRA